MKFRMLAIVFVVVCFNTAHNGFGAIDRQVVSSELGSVVLRIEWEFDFEPDSCLIVEEEIPNGWSLDEITPLNNDLKIREDLDMFAVAVDIGRSKSKSGGFEYRLIANFASFSDSISFHGEVLTMADENELHMPITGVRLYDGDGSERVQSEGDALKIIGVEITSEDSKEAMLLLFGTEPESENLQYSLQSDAVNAMSESSNPNTLAVDCKENLLSDSAWKCIHTSPPEQRVETPGCISITNEFVSGFYRIRVIDK